jgi:hypothetical protein
MRYKPKNTGALHIALGGLPEKMRVEVDLDLDIRVSGLPPARSPNHAAIQTSIHLSFEQTNSIAAIRFAFSFVKRLA